MTATAATTRTTTSATTATTTTATTTKTTTTAIHTLISTDFNSRRDTIPLAELESRRMTDNTGRPLERYPNQPLVWPPLEW